MPSPTTPFNARAVALMRFVGALATRPLRPPDPALSWTTAGFASCLVDIAEELSAAPRHPDPAALPLAALAPSGNALAAIDPQVPAMLACLEHQQAAAFPHDVGTFDAHLIGTWRILTCWQQPHPIARCGWFHSAYATDAYPLPSIAPARREVLQAAIGPTAEALVFLFCTLDRCRLQRDLLAAGCIPSVGLPAKNWATGEWLDLPPAAIAAYLIVELANIAEQTCRLGKRPGLWMHRVSRLATLLSPERSTSLSGFPTVVPPIFNRCTQTLDRDRERKALDLYLRLPGQSVITKSDRAVLEAIAQLNPWIAEPHLALAAIARSTGNEDEAIACARAAERHLWNWGTPWDKRFSWFEQVRTALDATKVSTNY
ncbi:hypothetical protein KR51_00034070 [Rubidibacter lacunae KORDI 51-2]|uniref:DUF6817 domain-containing protein n=1 Tax=Rubidibacter lacunae KORDI 51-2 TaxID=582515 RepID=U5DHP6_9CHRO|nr:hypothetical protein [Rubidibacter lacunae]ERN40119.1 hypothetical protein KR51_00034070 [Rubidibacter lacunae KORDI 51-2]